MTAETLRRQEAPQHVISTLLAQIAAALAELEKRPLSDTSVHSARKRIKQARATLRLMRYALPDATFRRTNLTLRDAARPLSATRDAKILIDALDDLTHGKRAIKVSEIAGLRRVLVGACERAQRAAVENKTGIDLSRRLLQSVQRGTARRHVVHADWPVLCKGLKRTYSRGRRRLAQAREESSAERLHEWRKDVKLLWHQLELLQPLRPGPIGKLADRAHKLSDHLGDDHDLAVLRERVLAGKAELDKEPTRGQLLALIDRRRNALQTKAFALGRQMYSDKGSKLGSRFDRYWRHASG